MGQGGAVGVGAGVGALAVGGGGAGGFSEPPVGDRGGVEDGVLVGAADQVVGLDPGLGQGGVVERDLVDGAGEEADPAAAGSVAPIPNGRVTFAA